MLLRVVITFRRAALTLLAFAIASAALADTMPLSQVRKGMKGYGLTVFKGTEPERFDVEVVGVLRNFRPSQNGRAHV